jgi:hypothetical protein
LQSGVADICTAKDIPTSKVIGRLVGVMVPLPPRLPNQDTLIPATDGTPLHTTSEDSQTQLVETPIDPTVTSTTCVTSTINQAIHSPKSSAKPTVTLAEEATRTDATYTDLRDLDKAAVPVLGDTAHDGTEGPSFVPPKIVIPSQDIISRVEGIGKVGERSWIPSTAIDAYLEMLSNHVNTIAGRVVVGVLSSSFWGWPGARLLLFGQREATFTSSTIMTILVPRLANGNHWQLVEIDKKHKEIRVYCSMGFHMGSKDFLVCPAIDSCWIAYR